MNVVLPIAGRSAPPLPRPELEAVALSEFTAGRLTKRDLRRWLGFSTGIELDEFLKSHDVVPDYAMADLERDRRDLKQFGV